MHPRSASLALLVLAALPCVAQADVIVVDASGAGDYTSIDDASFFAADGDTLLIRPILPSGQYGISGIGGKSLTLVGDPQAAGVKPSVTNFLIEDITATQRVVLRGLRVMVPKKSFTSPVFPAVYVIDCAGSLWIEDCELIGQEPNDAGLIFCFPVLPGGAGLEVHNSSGSITVVRSALTGGKGTLSSPGGGETGHGASDGGAGAWIRAADAAFFECTLTGGAGGDGSHCFEVGDGGAGVRAENTSLLLAGCTLQGGGPGSAGTGGPGLLGDDFAFFELLETTLAGGAGGPTVDIVPGSATGYPGAARSFALDSPLREGEGGTLAMQGVQGDFVGFFWSFGAGSLPMPNRNGWFLLNPAQLGGPFFIGFITDPGGAWAIPITAPQLLPGLEGQTFLLQAWFQYPGGVTLGSGTSLTLVDQAF